jgi:hypothetical protein
MAADMAETRHKILPWALGGLVLLVLVLGFVFRVRHDMRDFEVNYEAAQRLRKAESLYRVEDQHYMFKYLPASAILYAPLTYFPPATAKALWYSLILLCSGLIIHLSGSLLPHGKHRPGYVWFLPPLILLKYFFREWDLGQINTVVTVVLLLMLGSLISALDKDNSRREAAAGVLWGVSTALKPYAVIFLLYLILKKKWRAAGAGILTLGAALILPSLYYGWKGNLTVHREWLATLSQSTPHFLDTQDNISLFAFFLKWTGSRNLALPLAGAAIAALALLVFWMILKGREPKDSIFLEGAVLLTCIPLVSPLGWDYTLIMSLPLLMLLLWHFRDLSRWGRVVLVLDLLIVFVSLYDFLGAGLYEAFMSWSLITLNFLVILGFGFWLRLRRLA